MQLQRTVLSKQPFSNFPYKVEPHFRILQNFKHLSSYLPLLKLIKFFTLPSSSSREGEELGGGGGGGLTSGLAVGPLFI